ncbi:MULTISPECIES: hypothetical protein [unclassified Pseudonocardia]|uniref:hypothetical protein n=1 Tax=unclassified Pseudonocardia TaxID=2619320 RepID=UPI0001FFE2B8|nr:hypothetical protein [Pseudonocardia sp. Ae707_Ps1]OLM20865.1 hypothetical protein Ae707Ps1_5124c [Pseudonocardia sp. Ae707_Ps1]
MNAPKPTLTDRVENLEDSEERLRLTEDELLAYERAEAYLRLLHARSSLAAAALEPRWSFALAAVDAGASLTRVADAAHLDVDELRVGINAWIDRQLAAGYITAVHATAARTLLAGAVR